jgi:4-amino-4-deoxy-L-arabinose transferase-like glycosyltransferase
MPVLTGLPARIVYALLAGVVTYVLLYIVGIVTQQFLAAVGDVIIKFAAIIALLVALWYFFAGYTRFGHAA